MREKATNEKKRTRIFITKRKEPEYLYINISIHTHTLEMRESATNEKNKKKSDKVHETPVATNEKLRQKVKKKNNMRRMPGVQH